MYGRNLPHRVRVRSEITPISGSLTMSQNRAMNMMVPAAAAEIPKVSV